MAGLARRSRPCRQCRNAARRPAGAGAARLRTENGTRFAWIGHEMVKDCELRDGASPPASERCAISAGASVVRHEHLPWHGGCASGHTDRCRPARAGDRAASASRRSCRQEPQKGRSPDRPHRVHRRIVVLGNGRHRRQCCCHTGPAQHAVPPRQPDQDVHRRPPAVYRHPGRAGLCWARPLSLAQPGCRPRRPQNSFTGLRAGRITAAG